MHSNLEKKNNRNTSVFIDASNIGSGGGIAHIKNLLSRAPSENITYTIWIDKKYLKDLPQKDNFEYKSSFMFNLPFPMKFIWKIVFFRLICIKNKPDILLSGEFLFKHQIQLLFFKISYLLQIQIY